MQQSIKTLLNKKKWSGKEVGQIAIARLVHAYKGELTVFTQRSIKSKLRFMPDSGAHRHRLLQ